MNSSVMFGIMRVLKRKAFEIDGVLFRLNQDLKKEIEEQNEQKSYTEMLILLNNEELEEVNNLIDELNKDIKKECGKTYEEYFAKPKKKKKEELKNIDK